MFEFGRCLMKKALSQSALEMKSMREAEEIEADLPDTYDYAWNKRDNDTPSHDKFLKYFVETTSKDTNSLSVSGKLRNLCHNETSSKLDPDKPLLLENGSIVFKCQENNGVFSKILKFGRSIPRLLTVTFDTNKDCADICGVFLGHGCVCTRPPAEARKRCPEHKGMKIDGLKSKLIVEHKPVLPICGFTLENGYVCTSHIVLGRKRCEEHKGKKIKQQSEKLKLVLEKSLGVNPTCGVNIEDGSFCTRQAVIGRKRCEEHKGRKIKHQFVTYSALVSDTIPSSSNTFKPESSKPKIENTIGVGTTCGVNLEDGGFCTRSPVKGRKRCLQHKSMRGYSERSPSSSTSTFDGTRAASDMCGAGLQDGSICRRAPVRGRKRCEQHKGMRATFW